MYASTFQSDQGQTDVQHAHQRVSAAGAASFKTIEGATKLDRLYQQGSAKIRFPKNHRLDLEAVLINTAGGLTGGDRLSWDLQLDEGADVVVSAQACEKAYRSSGDAAQLNTQLNLGKDSTLHWLPQETILYEGSALSRSYDVMMEEGATLLAVESIVLGREAMGETIHSLQFRDRWRIRQNGSLVFADDLRFCGGENSIAQMKDCRAVASLLFVNGRDDEHLQSSLKALRELCSSAWAGFSAFEGKITGRILTKDSYALRRTLIPVLKMLRGTDLPRVWRT
ncbi:MAG: urease accessory protein UreD [Pseudomonadota bacterium]